MADPLLIRVEMVHERLVELLNATDAVTTIQEDHLIRQIQIAEQCNDKLTSELRFYLEKSR